MNSNLLRYYEEKDVIESLAKASNMVNKNQLFLVDIATLIKGMYQDIANFYAIPRPNLGFAENNSWYGLCMSGRNLEDCLILLDNQVLSIPCYQIIHTSLHEIRHHIQHAAITYRDSFGGQALAVVEDWTSNFANYYNSSNDEKSYLIYFFQVVEEDANTFAMKIIDAYITKHKNSNLATAIVNDSAQYQSRFRALEASAKSLFGANFRQVINDYIFGGD